MFKNSLNRTFDKEGFQENEVPSMEDAIIDVNWVGNIKSYDKVKFKNWCVCFLMTPTIKMPSKLCFDIPNRLDFFGFNERIIHLNHILKKIVHQLLIGSLPRRINKRGFSTKTYHKDYSVGSSDTTNATTTTEPITTITTSITTSTTTTTTTTITTTITTTTITTTITTTTITTISVLNLLVILVKERFNIIIQWFPQRFLVKGRTIQKVLQVNETSDDGNLVYNLNSNGAASFKINDNIHFKTGSSKMYITLKKFIHVVDTNDVNIEQPTKGKNMMKKKYDEVSIQDGTSKGITLHPNEGCKSNSEKNNSSLRYSHRLRWYNITLQEKGFHHIYENALDTSNINGF
ncbi:hypothetical protein H8356DRAFT_1366804 [Neocallimastix lanati (nom. inval.)]|nr:hypothetical protein H8356DRAFT_1366804 [Neocallimastix sp. JGI-2020a]